MNYKRKIKLPLEEQIDEFYFLYTRKGMTLDKIGKKFKVTRQRINQVLSKHPDWNDLKKTPRHCPPVRPLVPIKCMECGNLKLVKPYAVNYVRFCSKKCRTKNIRKNKLPIKEIRRRKALYANRYYHEVLKKDPNYPTKLRMYNHRAWLKRKNEKRAKLRRNGTRTNR